MPPSSDQGRDANPFERSDRWGQPPPETFRVRPIFRPTPQQAGTRLTPLPPASRSILTGSVLPAAAPVEKAAPASPPLRTESEARVVEVAPTIAEPPSPTPPLELVFGPGADAALPRRTPKRGVNAGAVAGAVIAAALAASAVVLLLLNRPAAEAPPPPAPIARPEPAPAPAVSAPPTQAAQPVGPVTPLRPEASSAATPAAVRPLPPAPVVAAPLRRIPPHIAKIEPQPPATGAAPLEDARLIAVDPVLRPAPAPQPLLVPRPRSSDPEAPVETRPPGVE